MLTREHLRLKIFQTLYQTQLSKKKDLMEIEKELYVSIQKTYDIYIYYFLLLDQLLRYSNYRIALGKQKKLPAADDLQPNLKFVNNRVLNKLTQLPALSLTAKQNKISLENEELLIQSAYQYLLQQPAYQSYMQSEEDSFEHDQKSLVQIAKALINFQPFLIFLTEKSVYAQLDDIDRMASMVIKTVKKIPADAPAFLYPAYKLEYKPFISTLLRKTVINSAWIEEKLKQNSSNWDIERFATIDIVLLKMAITEALEFDSIPTKVTMDEYIEFSKHYSTEKSSTAATI